MVAARGIDVSTVQDPRIKQALLSMDAQIRELRQALESVSVAASGSTTAAANDSGAGVVSDKVKIKSPAGAVIDPRDVRALDASKDSVDTGLDQPLTQAQFAGLVPILAGTWTYEAGVSGTVNVSGRVLEITAVAGGSGATVTIDGGDTVTIPANGSWATSPLANLADPEIVFTGTVSYFVQVVS